MAEIGIKELKAAASQVIDEVEGGAAYVVTKRGKPAAVLLPIDEAEDIVLANAGEFVRMRRQGRAAYKAGRTTRLRDLR
jgi:prevent-host-death family protein